MVKLSISSIVGVAVGLILLFTLLSTVVFSNFNTLYSFNSCSANSTIIKNTSAWTEVCSAPFNNTDCYQCTNWGARDTIRGIELLIITIGLIGFAVYFLKFR